MELCPRSYDVLQRAELDNLHVRFRVEGDDMPTVGLGVLVKCRNQKHPLDLFFLSRARVSVCVVRDGSDE